MISPKKLAWMVRYPHLAWQEWHMVRKLAASLPEFTGQPHFAQEDIETVTKLLDPDRTVIEYGSGSSTFYLAARSSRVASVDSSKNYVSAVREEARRRNLTNIHVSMVDIGPVRDWGWPIDQYPTKANIAKWKRYLSAPWENIGQQKVGLVVVDGRFRAACAAYAMARLLERGETDAVVFLDDYIGREESYDKLTRISDLQQTNGRSVIVKCNQKSVGFMDDLAESWLVDLR
jgi:hypothetical protein